MNRRPECSSRGGCRFGLLTIQIGFLALAACSPDTTPDAGDGASVDGATEDAAADGAALDAGDAADATDADASNQDGGGLVPLCIAPCGSGTKACDGRCVSAADPTFGCGGNTCTSCSFGFKNGSPSCQNGSCAIGSCQQGFANCDGNSANGCEADLRSPSSCLSCNTACSGNQVCTTTGCASACPFPYTNCGGMCRDLSSDPSACGSCNAPCPAETNATATCSSGVCGKICNAGFSSCGGQCKHTQDDPTACGNGCAVCPVPANSVAICTGAVCDFSCPVGYTKCAGGCANYFSDDANCGGCGVACSQGQTCLAGTCTSPTSARVVTGLSAPQDLVVDGTNVYFTDTGTNTVTQVNKTTWAATPLGVAQAKPYRIAVDGTHVYWSSNLGGAILRAPIGGGSSATVLYAVQNPIAIAVDSTFVYWSDVNGHERAPKLGGGQPTLLSTYYAFDVKEYQSNASAIYGWAGSGPSATYSIDKATGAFSVLTTDSNPYVGMAITSEWAYYVKKVAGHTRLQASSVGNTPFGQPIELPSTAGTPMIADDCGLFWGAGTEIWVRLERTNVFLLVTRAATKVTRLGLDSTYVYWTDAGGYVGRVRRP